MRLKSYLGPNIDLALELSTLLVNTRPGYSQISPCMLTVGHTLTKDNSKLPTLPETANLDHKYQFLYKRIGDLHDILKAHLSNPVDEPGSSTLLEPNDLVRIKVSTRLGFNQLISQKYSADSFHIISVNKDNLTYKVENTKMSKTHVFATTGT